MHPQRYLWVPREPHDFLLGHVWLYVPSCSNAAPPATNSHHAFGADYCQAEASSGARRRRYRAATGAIERTLVHARRCLSRAPSRTAAQRIVRRRRASTCSWCSSRRQLRTRSSARSPTWSKSTRRTPTTARTSTGLWWPMMTGPPCGIKLAFAPTRCAPLGSSTCWTRAQGARKP